MASFDLLQLALAEVRNSLVPTPPAAPPPPTPEEIAAAERKRLTSLDFAGLKAELAKRRYQKPPDQVSPDCAVLQTKGDVKRLSGPQLSALLYRPSDGSSRRANTDHINRILAGNN